MRYLYFIILFGLIIVLPASAYLDPGTGSMIVSAIIGIGATLVYVFKGAIFKFFGLFKKKKKASDDIPEDGESAPR